MRPQQLHDALWFHGQYRQPVIVLGKPGVGKSTIFHAVFRKLGMPAPERAYTMNIALSDGTDNRGLPMFIKNEEGREIVRWIKEGHFLQKKPFVLFLDELFQGQTAVMNVCAPIILELRIDDLFLPYGSWVCAASNRMEDKAGTSRVPSHIPNRATILYGPDANVDEWAAHMLDQGRKEIEVSGYVPPLELPTERDIRVVQFLRMKSQALDDFDPNRMINATPRQWEWVAQFLPVMPKSIRHDVISGRVGEGYASELMAFIKIEDQLPARERILSDPKKTPVPTEPSALYLVAGMLASISAVDNFDAIATYADRMPPEFQAMLVKDAMRITPDICHTKAFISWGVKFSEVLR